MILKIFEDIKIYFKNYLPKKSNPIKTSLNSFIKINF